MRAIRIGKLNQAELDQFVKSAKISAILDASHPFAIEISQLAIAHSQKHQIPYLRFERVDLCANYQDNADQRSPELVNLLIDQQQTASDQDLVKCSDTGINNRRKFRQQQPGSIGNDRYDPVIVNISSLEELFTPAIANQYLINKNVLLTLGCKSLSKFKDWHNRANLYARVLPQSQSINMAEQAGFSTKQLIAIRPPIAAALEKALWQQWQIQTVITKASGRAGGEDLKRAIAGELKVPLIIIDRARVNYPAQTSNLDQAIDFCKQWAIV
jgi:precorrin-6A/cobalt-precorrin-6A reductase